MQCETVREQLSILSDGERLENRRTKTAVWRHCLHCPSCRAYRHQLRMLQQTARHLPSALPDALRVRVLSQLPDTAPGLSSQRLTRTTTKTFDTKEITMKKRWITAACATLALAVTGTLAAQKMRQPTESGFSNSDGYIWRCFSSFRGEVNFYDAKGKPFGTLENGYGDTDGDAELNVQGERHTIHGIGRHEIRSVTGNLLGYAVMSTVSEKDYLHRMGWTRLPHDWQEALVWSELNLKPNNAVSGVSGGVLSVRGFDKQMGLTWKVQGEADVRVNKANGESAEVSNRPISAELRQLLPPDSQPPRIPKLTYTLNGVTKAEDGYGVHTITDVNGKPLVTLNVQPLADHAK